MSEITYEWSEASELIVFEDGKEKTFHRYENVPQEFEDLKRQLDEAREEIQDLKNIGNMFKCFVPANIADLYNEQLKEQGENE